MRKALFSLALAMAVLSSCSSDDIVNNPMNEENHSFPASRSLHENILSFSSEEEYNALLDSLGTWKSHSTLTLLATQDLPTFLYYMIDPLKSWCWGAILFYPFKNSRFS